MKMVNSKLLGAVFCAAMFWVGCSGSQTNNSTAENSQEQTAQTETPAEPQPAENKPATAENLWTSYLKSDYCDVASVDVDAALKVLEKKNATVSTLVIDPYTGKSIDRKSKSPKSDSDDSALSNYYETLSIYTLKDGGNLALVYSARGDGGRTTLQVFEYKNGTLTRLKNSFPAFKEDMLINKNELSESDKLAKFNGTEVWFFDYSYKISGFSESGFLLEKDHSPFTSFDWDGATFKNQGSM